MWRPACPTRRSPTTCTLARARSSGTSPPSTASSGCATGPRRRGTRCSTACSPRPGADSRRPGTDSCQPGTDSRRPGTDSPGRAIAGAAASSAAPEIHVFLDSPPAPGSLQPLGLSPHPARWALARAPHAEEQRRVPPRVPAMPPDPAAWFGRPEREAGPDEELHMPRPVEGQVTRARLGLPLPD